ncbi:hypothetical protein [Hyphococcus sp.]|uniref:hypothetical protein n=1 Tax=Hyphococcus sp. TaxID=2038636 RepID=UPI003CCB8DCE
MSCKICEAGKADAVNVLFAQGVSFAKIAALSGFSIQNLRTHRTKHYDEKAYERLEGLDADYGNTIISELKLMLDRVRKEEPEAFDLQLKIIAEIQKALRWQTNNSEARLLKGSLDEKAKSEAQIRALIAKIIEATSDYPQAQKQIRNAIREFSM